MKRALLFISTMVLLGTLGLISQAMAQPAPPPPPPPPEAPAGGPVYAPPPPPVAAPLPPRCGVYPTPPCHRRPVLRPWRRPFWRVGPYIGLSAGGFGVLGAKGPYAFLNSGGYGNFYVGMNFSPHFALELGFIGSGHEERFSGDPNALMLWGVSLDAKFNLLRPSWRQRFVPYLQAGGGVYGLYSETYWDAHDLARGGGFQAGGGLDIYLTRWLTLGGRLLYRGIVLGALRTTCGGQCVSTAEEDRTYINGLTGEVSLSIVF